MPKKEFKCICKDFKARGKSKILEGLEECPICGRKIPQPVTDPIEIGQVKIEQVKNEQPEENQILVLTAQDHLLMDEKSLPYFVTPDGTSERNQRVIAMLKGG